MKLTANWERINNFLTINDMANKLPSTYSLQEGEVVYVKKFLEEKGFRVIEKLEKDLGDYNIFKPSKSTLLIECGTIDGTTLEVTGHRHLERDMDEYVESRIWLKDDS